jgi:hypothetical protein
MATGTRFTNPIIEISRGNPRQMQDFIPAKSFIDPGTGTITLTYDASDDLAHQALTAQAADLDPYLVAEYKGLTCRGAADSGKGEIARGAWITGISVIHAVTTNAATTHTVTANLRAHADNTATTAVAQALSGSGGLSTDVNSDADDPHVDTLTFTTPFVIPAGSFLQFLFQMDGHVSTTGGRMYGMYVNYDFVL